ncbi:peptidase domain-containing ABC transporter [Membranicola marinus]|uniref:Peptidase domain-containing ABC transporter n=1 Tax=Membranihabitans marinus TaxID=1227546 RepID=A0A953LAP3_9BACT|nr:peptidase domain-containing ABC transporter [Membranihabitans marinus]MBY5957791.1 peptidase domain-containing ABC transporter [Membranihabitans marinus]
MTHIHQHDQSDCGVACLASVLHYFHKEVPALNRLRKLSGTTASGTTMLGLVDAAGACGLDAEGYEADLESLRNCNELAILHVVKDQKWEHYVVCYGYDLKKKTWQIGDPADRHISFISDDELKNIWMSRKLILFKDPDPNKMVPSSRHQKFRWIKALIEKDINILGLALFLGICMSILGLSTAVFSQRLLDDILPSGDMLRLMVGLGLLLVLLFIRSGFSLIRQIFIYRQSRDFNTRTLDFFFGRLIRLPMTFFTHRKTGDLVARLNDIQRIQKTISSLIADVMIDVIMILVASIAVMAYNLKIGFFVLAWVPIYGLIIWRYHSPIVKGQERVMKKYAENEHNFVQVVRGIAPIKSYRRESIFKQLTNQIFSTFQESIYTLSMIGARFNFISEVVGTFFLVSVLAWTSWSVYSGDMTAGALMAILQMTGLIMASAGNLAITNIQLQEARIAFNRMYEFTSLSKENTGTSTQTKSSAEFEELTVNALSFRFPGHHSLLKDVSFQVKKGEIIGIWGEIGSGKSTLFNVLLRFLKHESGQILINGKEHSEFSLDKLRSIIGIVPQTPIIFNGSLLDNILLGLPADTPEVLQEFLEAYHLDQQFSHFPNGLMTTLEEDGVNISGGQRRLISLARALYHNPQLLLLDEPTSDLDYRSVQYLFSVLENLRNRAGVIVLTHDVRMARQADRIYLLENGTIDTYGTHDHLLKDKNNYSQTWEDYLIPVLP